MDRVHWERDLSPYYGSVESKRKGFVHFFKKWKSYALHNSRVCLKTGEMLDFWLEMRDFKERNRDHRKLHFWSKQTVFRSFKTDSRAASHRDYAVLP